MDRDICFDIKKLVDENGEVMMTSTKINDIIELINSSERPSYIRKGQFIFNNIYKLFVGIFGTRLVMFDDKTVDCFFRDDKIPDFIFALSNETIGETYKVKDF